MIQRLTRREGEVSGTKGKLTAKTAFSQFLLFVPRSIMDHLIAVFDSSQVICLKIQSDCASLRCGPHPHHNLPIISGPHLIPRTCFSIGYICLSLIKLPASLFHEGIATALGITVGASGPRRAARNSWKELLFLACSTSQYWFFMVQ